MIRKLYNSLPGPALLRGVLIAALTIVAISVLFVVFERAGDLLDNGGVIQ